MFRIRHTHVKWRRIREKLLDELSRGGRRVAEFAVKDITAKMQAGVKDDGTQQKQNRPATRRQKQRTLGHSVPLIGSAKPVLSDASAWTLTPTGRNTIVSPPSARRTAIARLTALGYDVPGISETTRAFAVRVLRSAHDKIKSQFTSLIRGRRP